MESTGMILTQTLSDDFVHQQDHLKDAVSLAFQQNSDMFIVSRKEALNLTIQQDTDMIIVSKDKKHINCHSSLLALFSPVIARLMSGVTCCSFPTIFLPDFTALSINKLLDLLSSGQAIPGENVSIDIKIIKKIAEVLQISITDLNLGPWLDNPLGVSFEIKKELSSMKKEINSLEREKEVLNLKQESENCNGELDDQPVQIQQEEKQTYEYTEEDVTEKTLKQEYMKDRTIYKVTCNGIVIPSLNLFSNEISKDDGERKTTEGTVKVSNVAGLATASIDEDIEGVVLTAEQYPNGGIIAKAKEPKEVIMDSSDDMVIGEAADVVLDKQMPHDCYEQAEESENMILERNEDDGNNTKPDGDPDLADETKSSEDVYFPLRRHMDNKHFPRPVRSKMSSQVGSSNKLKRIYAEEEQLKRNPHTRKKSHQCDVCFKSFSHRGNYKHHKMTHTGEKPHQCDVCSKSFSQLGNYKQHRMTHTGEKPHQCDVCSKSFSELSNYKRHRMTHTGEKPHQCEVCSKSFSQLSKMKLHKMTHTGKKPHQCDVCSKSFSDLSNYKRHRKTHTGEKPHQCAL